MMKFADLSYLKQKECEIMPRGKELEQLPMANIAHEAGKDATRNNREVLEGMVRNAQPAPADIEKENEDMM